MLSYKRMLCHKRVNPNDEHIHQHSLFSPKLIDAKISLLEDNLPIKS